MASDTTLCSLDFGNGFEKICIDYKVSKIPSAYSLTKPEGAVSGKTGARLKPKTFSLTIEDSVLWFGLDVLGTATIRELDAAKYDPRHIRVLFAAVLVKWLKQHGLNPDILNRLKIVCSMPPQEYQDSQARAFAEKAYKAAFTPRQSPWFIRSNHFDTFRLRTVYGGLMPETISYMRTNRHIKTAGFIVLVDIGYGTVDYVIYNGQNLAKPLLVSSQNNGLIQLFTEMNDVDFNRAELALLRHEETLVRANVHLNQIKNKLTTITRTLAKRTDQVNIVFLGGGCKLMTKEFKANVKRIFGNVLFKDEFENVRNNYQLAGTLQ